VPVQPLLARTGAHGSHVMLRAADGYYEVFPFEALENRVLAYGMNGRTRPWSLGRINVKWLTGSRFSTASRRDIGKNGGGTGLGRSTQSLNSGESTASATVAYKSVGTPTPGTRGIKTVEVSTDGGDNWTEAALSPQLSGVDVWRQWKYEWRPSTEVSTVVVEQ